MLKVIGTGRVNGMLCISVSYKKTPLSIRQKFACSKEEQRRLLTRLKKAKEITGGVVLSTCNRSEIYVTGGMNALDVVEDALVLEKGIEKEYIKTYCLYYSGKKAVRHLFRVVCGLDSMVLGEDEILHQVKEAYREAVENNAVNGELNIIFQGALHCARKSKAATRLSTTPVSIGTLTANTVEQYLADKGYREGKVLVIGATGKIGSIVVKDLKAKGISVIATRRRRHQGEEIFLSGQEKAGFVDFDKRYQYIPQVDAIVSATLSPHYTLTKGRFERLPDKKECLLIDLAVPYDIDKGIAESDDVILYDIDYFRDLAKENSNIKFGEIDKAETLLEECMEKVMKNLYVREFKNHIDEKKTEEWFSKMVYYLKDILDSDEFRQVLEKMESGFLQC